MDYRLSKLAGADLGADQGADQFFPTAARNKLDSCCPHAGPLRKYLREAWAGLGLCLLRSAMVSGFPLIAMHHREASRVFGELPLLAAPRGPELPEKTCSSFCLSSLHPLRS